MKATTTILAGLLTLALAICELWSFEAAPGAGGEAGSARVADVAEAPEWPMARMAYLRKHPACEACGATDELSVHHIVPREVWVGRTRRRI